MLSWKSFLESSILWITTSGLRVLFVAACTIIAIYLSSTAIKRLETVLINKSYDSPEREKRVRTLIGMLRKTIKISAVIVAAVIILNELGVDIRPIITAAGIGGLALGFGAQSLVRDVISGFFILLEDQIRVGDIVSLNKTSGEVVSISLRTTILRDLTGTVHVFPNGAINSLSNMTKDWSRYIIDLGISYNEDVDYIMGVLKNIGDELLADPAFNQYILEPLEIMGVDNFGPSEVIIKMAITTLPLKQWCVGRELRRRIKKKFDELGIEIPFPHTTVYWGKESQPFSINIDKQQKPEKK